MSRAPNSTSQREHEKRFLGAFDRQLADLQRRRVYRWTTDPDELSPDCIMVGIGGTSANMLAAGLSYVEPTASVSWQAAVTGAGFYEAGGDFGPFSVLDALRRADELQSLMGYRGVVILLNEVGIWRDEWGTLAEKEGLV